MDTIGIDRGTAGHAIAIEDDAAFDLNLIQFEEFGVVECEPSNGKAQEEERGGEPQPAVPC